MEDVMRKFALAGLVALGLAAVSGCHPRPCPTCPTQTPPATSPTPTPSAPAPVIVQFGTAAEICSGDKTPLVWEVTADQAAIGPNIGNVAIPRGNMLVSPTHDTVYTLTATNRDGQATSRDVLIKVKTCSTPVTPVDVCPNIPGNQETIPPGMVKDANGNCVTPAPGPGPGPGPTPDCEYGISPTTRHFGYQASWDEVTVTTTSTCPWNAVSNASFLTTTNGSDRVGSGIVRYDISQNTSTSERTGTLTVAGKTHTATQDGAPTTPALPTVTITADSTSLNYNDATTVRWSSQNATTCVGSGGSTGWSGTRTVSGSFPTGALTSTATFTISCSNSAGSASASVTVNVGPQPTCVLTVPSTTGTIPAAGSNTGISVEVNPKTCTWTSTTATPWIHIVSGTSGTGDGNVLITVDANTGATRTGTVTITGADGQHNVSVPQAAGTTTGCTFTVASTTGTIPAAGSNTGISVVTQAGCTWTATSNAGFVTIVSGASGTGSGSVLVTVAPNTGAPRTAVLTIAGQTVTVPQAGN